MTPTTLNSTDISLFLIESRNKQRTEPRLQPKIETEYEACYSFLSSNLHYTFLGTEFSTFPRVPRDRSHPPPSSFLRVRVSGLVRRGVESPLRAILAKSPNYTEFIRTSLTPYLKYKYFRHLRASVGMKIHERFYRLVQFITAFSKLLT